MSGRPPPPAPRPPPQSPHSTNTSTPPPPRPMPPHPQPPMPQQNSPVIKESLLSRGIEFLEKTIEHEVKLVAEEIHTILPPPVASPPKVTKVGTVSPAASTAAVSSPPPSRAPTSQKSNVKDGVLSADTEVNIKAILETLSEKYLMKFTDERCKQDDDQMKNINTTLKKWSETMTQSVQTLLKDSRSQSLAENPLLAAIGDSNDRKSRIVEDIKEAHKRQMDTLRLAIAEERKEASQAQQIFENTLQTRYENMVQALQEKVRAEQEARMQRAIEDLERSARVESERAKQAFEVQQAAESSMTVKFKSIVSDLRKSWEEEEVSRAKHLEERLRGHYSAVLEHMEAQLQMALSLQDDADRQWMEDVEIRNKQQVATLKAFEEKCRRLYDTRLSEYVELTDKQMSQYEQQLLQAGSNASKERMMMESKQRRLRLGCSRWKVEYQKQVHGRYKELLNVMETRYTSEIEKLLLELSSVRASVQSVNQLYSATVEQPALRALTEKQQNEATATPTSTPSNAADKTLLKSSAPPLSSPTSNNNSSNNSHNNNSSSSIVGKKASEMRTELMLKWTDLKTPVDERVDTLAELLDNADVTPAMLRKFEAISAKLNARLPITQAHSRKQFIEYKLRVGQRAGAADTLSSAVRAELGSELHSLTQLIEQSAADYEKAFGEVFTRPTAVSGLVTSGGSSNGVVGLSGSPSAGGMAATFKPRDGSKPNR